MITLSRYQGVRPSIDPDQDQSLITVPRKSMRSGKDLFISKGGVFYVCSWQIFNNQETAGYYQVSPDEAREMIKARKGEMNNEQQGAAEKIFPGILK